MSSLHSPLMSLALQPAKSRQTKAGSRGRVIDRREVVEGNVVDVYFDVDWVHAIYPEPVAERNWFKRDENALNINTLPHKNGVYEMAISVSFDSPKICVYVGKAESTCTLRKRIYSEYALKGSHKANEIRPFLELGCHVWFRWFYLPNKTACRDWEHVLIITYDYPLNKVSANSSYRGYTGVVCMIGIAGRGLCVVNALEYLHALKAIKEEREKEEEKETEQKRNLFQDYNIEGERITDVVKVVAELGGIVHKKLKSDNERLTAVHLLLRILNKCNEKQPENNKL